MVSYTAASIIAIAAAVSAQQYSPAPTGAALPGSQVACATAFSLCTSSNTNADICSSQRTACEATCDAKHTACSTATGANQAQCAADYAGCLGRNPYDSTSTVLATQVVSSYTTYCPYATTFYNNGQKYVATGPGVVTVTNCPCTVTVPVQSATPEVGKSTGPAGNTTVGVPLKFTGGANTMVAAGLSGVAAIAGVLAFAL